MKQPLLMDIQILLRVLIVIIFTFFLTQIVQLIKKRLARNWVERENDPIRKRRIATSLSIGITTLNGVIIIGGSVSLLAVLNINITPILTSLGLVGLALSLGAQALIKDFLAGMTILTEQQFSVGDEIKVGAVRGLVEEISMRATRVRDYSGLLYIFPNSEIRIVANASRDWMRAIVDINLPYSADLFQAKEVLKAAAARCAEDKDIKPLLLNPPEVTAWNSLNDWAVQIRLTARTLPGKQYTVQSELMRHAIDALAQAGIPIALPTVLSMEEKAGA